VLTGCGREWPPVCVPPVTACVPWQHPGRAQTRSGRVDSPGDPAWRRFGASLRQSAWSGMTPVQVRRLCGSAWLLPREHGHGFAFEVDVGVSADVDGDAVQGAAGEGPGCLAGIVGGDGCAAVAAGVEAFAAEGELAGLGLDVALADLVVAVVQRQDAPARRLGVARRFCRSWPTAAGSFRWGCPWWRRSVVR